MGDMAVGSRRRGTEEALVTTLQRFSVPASKLFRSPRSTTIETIEEEGTAVNGPSIETGGEPEKVALRE
jgi:hypothetical protein